MFKENSRILSTEKYAAICYDGKSSMPRSGILQLEQQTLRLSFDLVINSEQEMIFPATDLKNIDVISEHHIVLQFKSPEGLTIEVNNKNFFRNLKLHYPFLSAVKRNNFWIFSTPLRIAGIIGIAGITLLIFAYFYIIPGVAEFAAARFPVKLEQKIGTMLANKLMEDMTIDSLRTQQLQEFAFRLNYEGSFKMHPLAVKGPVLNAFAIPGGYIFVYDTLLTTLSSPSELAALLAHEYTHVEHHHTIRMFMRNIASYAIVSILLNDVSGVSAIVLQNAQSLKSLQYQRSMEEDADMTAVALMQKRNINPHGIISLLELLKKESPDIKYVSWFSTHPSIDKRIDKITSSLNSNVLNTQIDDSLFIYWNLLKK